MAVTKNPLLFRYPPNNRFINGCFKEQIECPVHKVDFGESVTDKESYRLSLAGKRGAIASGTTNTGWYMFPDGKYDHDKDFSKFYRKDLSIVEIDNYIKEMSEEQEKADSALKAEIQAQIDKAVEAREAAVKAEAESKGNE